MQNRDYVTPEDIHTVVKDVLRHRIALSYKGRAEGITSDQLIDKIIEVVFWPGDLHPTYAEEDWILKKQGLM